MFCARASARAVSSRLTALRARVRACGPLVADRIIA